MRFDLPKPLVWGAFVTGILGAIIGIVLLWPRQSRSADQVISPVILGTKAQKELYELVLERKTTENYPPNNFFPKNTSPKYGELADINARAYAVMDRKTGELLLGKNIIQELPIASITKIMTAVIALERADMDFEVTISSPAASIGEASMGLKSGDIVSVDELLWGLMLPSGNDAAEGLAEGLLGGRVNFMENMNQRAQELGMYDSFFFNPSGLDGETISRSNFSTCLDLLALTNYALTNPKFSEIVATHQKVIPARIGKHAGYNLFNILLLDYVYPGIKGVKPGVTEFAGQTLVSYASRGEQELIVVLLGSHATKDEVIKIYNYIFPKLDVKI